MADLNLGLIYYFEEVLLIDVLEHLNNPDKLTDKVYRVCKNKAKAIIKSLSLHIAINLAKIQHKRVSL